MVPTICMKKLIGMQRLILSETISKLHREGILYQ